SQDPRPGFVHCQGKILKDAEVRKNSLFRSIARDECHAAAFGIGDTLNGSLGASLLYQDLPMNRGKEASDKTNETRMALTVESGDADDLTFLQLKAKWFATDS